VQVVSKRNLVFVSPNNGEKYNLRKSTSVGEFTDMPDWVAETEYFKLCESDGTIKRVLVQSPPIEQKQEEPFENIGFGNRVMTGIQHTPSSSSRAPLKTK
jgi:hypothetical protein